MKSLDRLEQRVANLIEAAEQGEPIDWEQQARLQVLDTLSAGVEFTQDSLAAQRAADDEPAPGTG